MERDGEVAPAAAAPAAAAPACTNGLRSSNQLLVRHEGRKPLFVSSNSNKHGSRDERKHNDASTHDSPRLRTVGSRVADARSAARPTPAPDLVRRTKSESHPDRRQDSSNSNSNSSTSLVSPGGTRMPRMPRPSTSSTTKAFSLCQPISLAEAFKRAEDEELAAQRAQAADGSPSPAPRPWRARGTLDDLKMRQILGADHLDTKAHNGRLSGEASNGRPGGPEDDTDGGDGSDVGIADLVPGIEDVPLLSIEPADREPGPSPRKNADDTSPDKSFAWQVDDDFTGRDLQVSDSPRITVGSNRPFAKRPSLIGGDDKVTTRSPARVAEPGSRNIKLDEIRTREPKTVNQVLVERPQPGRRNTKLVEIRAREKAAAQQVPIPDRTQPRPKNTKLDEIRQREAQGLSKRAYAAARLEEIREQNSMSRSLSPEEARPHASREEQSHAATQGADGEMIPDTPITVFKSHRTTYSSTGVGATASDKTVSDKDGDSTQAGHTGNKRAGDSHDLLRRLARATSASPAPETGSKSQPTASRGEAIDAGKPGAKRRAPGRMPDRGRQASSIAAAKANDNPRPTVGFADLRRVHSSDSTRSKRSSGVNSEMDPTDRIEAEMKLFAPHENQSERGSVRAPSPQPGEDSDEDANSDELTEATPRPRQHQVLGSMPTPRVTGAYVETPATVKAGDRMGDDVETRQPVGDEEVHAGAPAMFRGERRSITWRNRDQDAASDPGTSDHKEDDAMSAAAALRRRHRARSLPRRRPPLKNSAKPPSVRDDLLELQRIHNIDDSTMDDIEDMLTGRGRGLKLERTSKEPPASSNEDRPQAVKREANGDEGKQAAPDKEEPRKEDDSEGELALYDRMSKSLRTGLLEIRSAKQGIERLEDQVSHVGKQTAPTYADTMMARADTHDTQGPKHDEQCRACTAHPNPHVAYIHLPVPRLYCTRPRFRLTALGLMVLLLSLWCAAEWAMCAKYCRPTTCAAAECVYSFDDPTGFGAALPVKLDQWTTGGRGRELWAWAMAETQEWVADMEDVLHGRPARTRDPAYEQRRRRQRRRRLGRWSRADGGPAAPAPPPEHEARWEAWRRTRQAKERAREARDMGYGDARDEDAAIGRDERAR